MTQTMIRGPLLLSCSQVGWKESAESLFYSRETSVPCLALVM